MRRAGRMFPGAAVLQGKLRPFRRSGHVETISGSGGATALVDQGDRRAGGRYEICVARAVLGWSRVKGAASMHSVNRCAGLVSGDSRR